LPAFFGDRARPRSRAFAAGAHVVLGKDLEESDVMAAVENLGGVIALEPHAGAS
jgi:hypothetical protein